MASNFQSKVIKTLKKNGYTVFNIIKVSDAGYPDILAIKDNVNLWIECKELRDTLKPLQAFRIDNLNKIQGNTAICLQDTKGCIYPDEYKYIHELEDIINELK